ncbi:taste receptor type 2 member 39-like [Rhinoderma darwinii]|uniref:taste receptor type 2 member 39-like n=1 Tax=Rhinoderma darwinii TaxID=43563 RepID=UPI003F660EB2
MYTEELVLLYISWLIVIIGLLLNGFILISNLINWLKRRTLQTIDVLITGLGLVRIVVLSVNMQQISILIFNWSLFQMDNAEFIGIVTMCMNFCSLWWGSVLCVFYCVKITTYNNRLFMRLKMNISKLVPWLLLISLVISFLSSLPFVYSHVGNDTVCGNGTMEINVVNLFLIIFAGSIIPFMIFCVAIYLIILSLLRHTRNMSSRDSGFSDAQRDIHLSVIRNMISFLLFFALHFVTYVMFSIFINVEISTFNLICLICMCAYPSLHSICLIDSNRELKNSFLIVLSCTWLRNWKH